MSAFDMTVRVGDVNLQVIEDESGKSHEAHLILGILALAPVGPGQAIPIPLGVIRVPLDKRSIKDIVTQLNAAGEQLVERTNIAIASDIGQAEQAATLDRNLRNG